MVLGYKTFEYLCDLQCMAYRLGTPESQHTVTRAQDTVGWPWCLSQTQRDDWEAMCRRFDPPVP